MLESEALDLGRNILLGISTLCQSRIDTLNNGDTSQVLNTPHNFESLIIDIEVFEFQIQWVINAPPVLRDSEFNELLFISIALKPKLNFMDFLRT